MYCRWMLPFNRWQCEPHLYEKLLCLQIWTTLRLQPATSVIRIVWQFTCLSIFFYPEKVAELAIFCTILQDKHTREQPTATTSDSCKVKVWDKNITLPIQHPSWSSGELLWQSYSISISPTFQDTDFPVILKIKTIHYIDFTVSQGLQARQ